MLRNAISVNAPPPSAARTAGQLDAPGLPIGLGFGGHAVFSRHGRALLLLPVRNRRVAAATLGLYRPQTRKAKLSVVDNSLKLRISALNTPIVIVFR